MVIMILTEIIKLTPEEAQKRNKEGWVLRLTENGMILKKARPSNEPREYEVLGKWD